VLWWNNEFGLEFELVCLLLLFGMEKREMRAPWFRFSDFQVKRVNSSACSVFGWIHDSLP
jgi:hypothetical protein